MDISVRWRLHDRDLTRRLMQRTGDGSRTTVRDLAKAAGVHPSHIGKLLKDDHETASHDVAVAWSNRIGTDLLVQWVPVERTDTSGRQLVKVAA